MQSNAYLYLALVGVAWLSCPGWPLNAADLRVMIKPQPIVTTGSKITVGDVAEIQGGTSLDRRRLAALDLDEMQPGKDACRISKRQLEMRCLVEGIARQQLDITGPDEVVVRRSTADRLREKLQEELASEIVRQFGLEDRSVQVRIADQQQVQSIEHQLALQSTKMTLLLPARLPLGAARLEVQFEKVDGTAFQQTFDVQIVHSRKVALATRPISRGSIVEAGMFRVIQRPIASREEFADPMRLAGHIASRDIASNEVVLSNHLSSQTADDRPVIRRNDLVDVVYRISNSEIRLKNARAMSQGRVGDTIELLNTRSNERLTATVVDAKLATISFIPSLAGVAK
jgi:flagella basal body P-ring formation protein FlgA